ncbi:hypothetical protein ES703_10729 [subsurface metagenome]
MRDVISDLANWPRRRNQEPIFQSTNEAYLYAQLIYNNPREQTALSFYRVNTYRQLALERSKKKPNFSTMIDLAARAHFYKECLEEVERIKKEVL